jgi:UDP-GlcNAc:undecaprenyl-phosphate GlcNAc-1-phosphate transferase
MLPQTAATPLYDATAPLPVASAAPPEAQGWQGALQRALIGFSKGASRVNIDPTYNPVAAGLVIDHITLPFAGAFDLGAPGYVLTVIWFVAIVNIINFTDGMDGLAAGVVGIGASTFAIIAASLGRADAAILAAALAGACLAFLRFNFNPARTFMGDGGSMFLGFMLAGIAITGVMKSAATVAIVLPLIVLAIPILDTSFVIMKRIKHGLPVYGADKSHFHHRFLAIGWSQRRTVLSIYAWAGLMSLLALAMRFVPYTDGHGNWNAGWTAVLGVIALVGLMGAIYLVYVLEILKWRSEPVVNIVRRHRARDREHAATRP